MCVSLGVVYCVFIFALVWASLLKVGSGLIVGVSVIIVYVSHVLRLSVMLHWSWVVLCVCSRFVAVVVVPVRV